MVNDPLRDYLTGLYTRQGLYILYNGMEPGSRFHMMFIDIDNFKNVNDMYGHNEGDALLRAFAEIMRSSAPGASAIRLGGDEFLLVFTSDYTRETLCAIADRIIERTRLREGAEHITTPISASIGILCDEVVGGTLNETLAKSDRAMYYAKNLGKGRCVVWSDIADQVISEMNMEKYQKTALENGELQVRFLPVMRAQTSTLRIARAQLIWITPTGIVRQQDEFLPVFERNGFIRQVDMWLIDRIIEGVSDYHRVTDIRITIGLRLSRLVLLESGFADRLLQKVLAAGISPSELQIEVDESAFERGSDELLRTMQSLRDKGFSIAVVGVGSDFKSLAFWDKISFDSITFDRQYLRTALGSARGRQILRTLLEMGRQLKMQVMADGISEQEDIIFLCGCGCNAISGPCYSEALPPKEFHEYILDKLPRAEHSAAFAFKDNYISVCGGYIGHPHGSVALVPGISDTWGGVSFLGGGYSENILELPSGLIEDTSYTVCMWIKPTAAISWSSVFYARFLGGFATYSPFVIGGGSFYRVSEDENLNGFHDVQTRHLQTDVWTFVCLTYDALSGIGRIYLNGRKAGFLADVPPLAACRHIVLGGDPFQPSFEGVVSGVSFYDRAKSEDEISAIYQEFVDEPGFCGESESFWA